MPFSIQKTLACFCAALGLLMLLSPTALAVSTSAGAAVLMDAESGRVLYAAAEHQPMRIASTTKLMTALVALEHYDLSDVVTVPRAAVLTEGSSMYLREGERLKVETLLYGLLLCSGNDAAETLAAFGGRARFVRWMNETAARLGMEDTSFENPSGLDGEGHRSTAYDMALLMACAVRNHDFLRIASTRTVTTEGRTMTNHNRLLSEVEGCIAGKTGFTKAAGRTLVSCARRGGVTLVAVTLRDGNDWADHAALYAYGFSRCGADAAPLSGDEDAAAAFFPDRLPGESAGLRIRPPAKCRLPNV